MPSREQGYDYRPSQSHCSVSVPISTLFISSLDFELDQQVAPSFCDSTCIDPIAPPSLRIIQQIFSSHHGHVSPSNHHRNSVENMLYVYHNLLGGDHSLLLAMCRNCMFIPLTTQPQVIPTLASSHLSNCDSYVALGKKLRRNNVGFTVMQGQPSVNVVVLTTFPCIRRQHLGFHFACVIVRITGSYCIQIAFSKAQVTTFGCCCRWAQEI